ncbi:MAG: AtpZ/AtpI family protein [Campylobacterales bacterium]|nr:AtpZ/AtpI family protein [Campylobacterales bacterium]
MSEQQEPKFKKVFVAANDLSLGISIVVAILIGVGIGIVLKNAFNAPWLLWLGVFWGVGAAFMNVYKVYQKQKRDLEKLADDPRYKNYKQPKEDDDEDDKY